MSVLSRRRRPSRTGLPAALVALPVAWLVVVVVRGQLPSWLPRVVHLAVLLTLAVVAFREARARRSRLGRGTWFVFAAACCWLVAGIARSLPGADFLWVSVGAVSGVLCLAAAASLAVSDPVEPQARFAAARLVINVVLVAAATCLLWWMALDDDIAPALVVATTVLVVANATLLVTALVVWPAVEEENARAASSVVAAAAVLLATTFAYALHLPSEPHTQSGLLDVAWSAAFVLLALAVTDHRRPGRSRVSPRRRWQLRVATFPLLALGAMVAAELVGHTSHTPLIAIAEIVVILTLVARQVLFTGELFAVTDRITAVGERLAWQAEHDPLTGLLTRPAFLRRATEVMAQRRLDGGHVAILRVDLDAFVRINDSLGHEVGDAVLCEVAERLLASSAPTDLLTRLGGDEFALFRPRLEGPAGPLGERVRAALARPVVADGLTLTVNSTIGIIEADGADEDVAQLLVDGDLVLYQAKRAGRNRTLHYATGGRPASADTTGALYARRMLDESRVIVRYQPVVELASNRIVGAEALTRLPGPDGGELAPGEFLPHLRALGLLPQLGGFVIARACADFARHPELGWVSVNVTSQDLADPPLMDRIRCALRRSGLAPARLVLEIDEQVVPEPHILRATRRISDMGVQVALDDFGTGWSSLAQLRDLPLRLVKIDRGVVAAAGAETSDERAMSMLLGSVAMARALDLLVVAEGIEHRREAVTAEVAGATLGQGFLWSAARDLRELVELVDGQSGDDRPGG